MLAGLLLAAFGFAVSLHLKIGDLDPGAPELRADSRYNRDALFMTQNYAASSDIFVVMIKTPEDQCPLRQPVRGRCAGLATGAIARRGIDHLDGGAEQDRHGRV